MRTVAIICIECSIRVYYDDCFIRVSRSFMVDINVHQQFRPSNTTTRGHHQRFLQLPTRVDAYMNSFFPFTIKLWNQPDDHIIQAPSLDLFNNYINL